MKTCCIECIDRRIKKEIEVLKKSQNRKIQNQGGDEQGFAGTRVRSVLDLSCDHKVDQRRCDHQQQKAPVPPTVEEVASQQEEQILPPPLQAPIHSDNKSEKQQVDGSIKKHFRGNFMMRTRPESEGTLYSQMTRMLSQVCLNRLRMRNSQPLSFLHNRFCDQSRSDTGRGENREKQKNPDRIWGAKSRLCCAVYE